MLAAMKHIVHPGQPQPPPPAPLAPGDPSPPLPAAPPRSQPQHEPRRTDVIDALDAPFSPAGGRVHHDSPYDALTPHRNRAQDPAPPVRAFAAESDSPLPPLSAGAQDTNQSAPYGFMSTAQASAAARAQSAAKRTKHTDLWGVNPDSCDDFATPEGDIYPAHPRPQTMGQLDSAASSAWDMEAILRGGRRVSPTPSAEGLRSHWSPPAEMASSPLPERDWSTVGVGRKKSKASKRKSSRRFTLYGGLRRGSDHPEEQCPPVPSPPTLQLGTKAGASSPTHPSPRLDLPSPPEETAANTQECPPVPILKDAPTHNVPVSPPSPPQQDPALSSGRRASVWQKIAKLGKQGIVSTN